MLQNGEVKHKYVLPNGEEYPNMKECRRALLISTNAFRLLVKKEIIRKAFITAQSDEKTERTKETNGFTR